jgi:zinc and cadmium transporter
MDIYLPALGLSLLIALISVSGALFFGGSHKLISLNKHIAPLAVGVFLSLILIELLPETISHSPEYGGIMIAVGFISFYVLSSFLHRRFHKHADENCDRKGAAILLLIGDAIHNVADGIILGGAFLVDPALGVATAIGLALHELPQEIIEFGVLLRAGYSRSRAVILNLLSASSIILGTTLTIALASHGEAYIWILSGIAAGNLLYIATSDLLPRIHGNLAEHGGIWRSSSLIIAGFIVMTIILHWSHEQFGHGHNHDHSHENTHHEAYEHDHDTH